MNNQTRSDIQLIPLKEKETETFITNIQVAFRKAVIEEFGDDGTEVIPREEVIAAFQENGAESYNIVYRSQVVGGAILVINQETNYNEPSLLFINVDCHSIGLGYAAWQAIEKLHPETKVWKTCTPYFEKRNIHFYVNKCGFHIVEFFNPSHPEANISGEEKSENIPPEINYFFRFEKNMQKDI